MPPPVVTVLLPARNAERTGARAVESLLEGTPREIRVLAVDDGSTDGTRAVLDGLAARDARVEVLEGGGRGLVAALNLALAHATSPYVARMDADDEALPRRLEASVAALEADPGLGGVGTGVERFIDVHPRKVGTRIHGIPVDAPESLGAPPEDTHLIAAVGVRGIRDEIRAALSALGWVEGVHFTCAA